MPFQILRCFLIFFDILTKFLAFIHSIISFFESLRNIYLRLILHAFIEEKHFLTLFISVQSPDVAIFDFQTARRGAAKKPTTNSQPKVECVERSVNAGNTKQEQKPELSASSGADAAPHAPFKLDASSDLSHGECAHGFSQSSHISGASMSTHLLAHYYQQSASISPDELRGIIAGMAAMAAQSNSVISSHFFFV